MGSDDAGRNNDLELKRLDLERYKIRLNYRKYVLGSVFVAIAIALIPPSFQLATAHLEYVKTEAARLAKMEEFHEEYVREFLSTALNQDIELRVRFAQYFSFVSSGQFQQDWRNYRDELKSLRESKRQEIDALEDTWRQASTASHANSQEVDKLERHLKWAYNEAGYIANNRSVASDPRAPPETGNFGISLTSIPPGRRAVAQLILDRFAAAGFGQVQQVAALADAFSESKLDPGASIGTEIGLFPLSPQDDIGKGHTKEELKNPDVNLGLVIKIAKQVPEFASAVSIREAVTIFVLKISRPRDPMGTIARVLQIAGRIIS